MKIKLYSENKDLGEAIRNHTNIENLAKKDILKILVYKNLSQFLTEQIIILKTNQFVIIYLQIKVFTKCALCVICKSSITHRTIFAEISLTLPVRKQK